MKFRKILSAKEIACERFGQLCEANAAVPAGCCIVPRPAEGQEKKGKGMKATKVEHSQRMQEEAQKDEGRSIRAE